MAELIDSDIATSGFSVQTAYYLAKACQASYLDVLGDWATILGMGAGVSDFHFEEFNGFVAVMDQIIVLAFRGTDNIANWLTDGHIVQVEDPAYPGKVHRGFAGGLEVMWSDLKALLPPPAGGRPVLVTGHSLGGALATLAAVRLEAEGFQVKATYTYGSPRVGNVDFYEAYHPVNYRFVNNNDIVPHVPLELLLLGVPSQGLMHFSYKHVGTLKYLDRHGKLGEGMSGWGAKKEFILNALTRSGGVPEPQAIADHHIENYAVALAANL